MCAFASDNTVFYAQSTSTVISEWAFASGCCILLYMQLTWMLKRHVINRMTVHLALYFGVSAGGPGAAGRCGDLCQQEVGCEPDGVQQHCGGAGRRLQLAVLLLLYTLHLSGQFLTVCVEGGWGGGGVGIEPDRVQQHCGGVGRRLQLAAFTLLRTLHLSGQFQTVCVEGGCVGGVGVEPDRVQQHCGGVGRRLQLAAFTLLCTLHLSGQFQTVCVEGGLWGELGLNQTEYNSIVVELGGDYNWQHFRSHWPACLTLQFFMTFSFSDLMCHFWTGGLWHWTSVLRLNAVGHGTVIIGLVELGRITSAYVLTFCPISAIAQVWSLSWRLNRWVETVSQTCV